MIRSVDYVNESLGLDDGRLGMLYDHAHGCRGLQPDWQNPCPLRGVLGYSAFDAAKQARFIDAVEAGILRHSHLSQTGSRAWLTGPEMKQELADLVLQLRLHMRYGLKIGGKHRFTPEIFNLPMVTANLLDSGPFGFVAPKIVYSLDDYWAVITAYLEAAKFFGTVMTAEWEVWQQQGFTPIA